MKAIKKVIFILFDLAGLYYIFSSANDSIILTGMLLVVIGENTNLLKNPIMAVMFTVVAPLVGFMFCQPFWFPFTYLLIIGALMGLWSSFKFAFRSINKTRKLVKISKKISAFYSVESLIKCRDEREKAREEMLKAREEMLDVIENNEQLRKVMQNNNYTRDDVNKLLTRLLVCYSNQWVNGHYVPVSSLMFVPTLEYLIKRIETGCNLDETSMTLVDYFAENRTYVAK